MVNFETDSIGNMRRADFAVFSPSVFLKSLLVFLFVLYSSVVCAKPVAYDVVINAPESVKKILMNNLDLLRWKGNEQMDTTQLRRLYRNTPDEIRQLVETEGYYSPVIHTRMEKTDNNSRKVIIDVDPGKPVKVAAVDITFEGAITKQAESLKPGIEQLK